MRKTILEIYTTSKKRVGPAKVQRMLLRDYGFSISISRVYRLMSTMNLPKMSTVKSVFKPTAGQVSLKNPNHLKQAFNPPAPNQVWTSDFSYIPVEKKSLGQRHNRSFLQIYEERRTQQENVFFSSRSPACLF